MVALFRLIMKYLWTLVLSVFLAGNIIYLINTDSYASEEVSPTAQQYLMNLSMTQQDAYVLISECEITPRPNKCIMYWWAIRAQEWWYDTRHPFGMLSQPSRYKWETKEKTTAEYVELRVWSFTRYRHRNNKPSDYLTRSNYCTSGCEHRIPNVTRFIAGYESGNIPQDIQETGTPPTNYWKLAKEAEERMEMHKAKMIWEQQEALKMRAKCKGTEYCKE